MKQLPRLIGYVLLGLITALGCYTLVAFGILETISSSSGRSPESMLGIAFYIAFPLSWLLGSGITGFLSSPHIKTNVGFVLVSPGFYYCLAGAAQLFFNWEHLIRWYAVEMAWLQVLWFLASWSGVGIGHLIRSRLLCGSLHEGASQAGGEQEPPACDGH
jgi:hypothetical protein